MKRKEKPFIIKTPYPTTDEVAEELGIPEEKREEIKKRVERIVDEVMKSRTH